jgi:hypothetical protein
MQKNWLTVFTVITVLGCSSIYLPGRAQDKSKSFYDSIYARSRSSRVTSMLYDLAFVPPRVSSLPDTLQTQKIEDPFLPFVGKIIRNVRIVTLDPFGPTIFDTAGKPHTGLGKFGNRMHITTQNIVVRKNLMFRHGQQVDPAKIADNQRILKELPYIDDARILLTETSPGSDSVDATVIVKDVFPVGGTVIIIGPLNYRGTLYDQNLLGTGNRLALYMSVKNARAPFFRFDGISCDFTNILGSFLDGQLYMTRDDGGNQQLFAGISRAFYSYSVRFAGGLNFTLATTINPVNDSVTNIGHYNQEYGWLGYAHRLMGKDSMTRFILTGGIYNRYYMTRPRVQADSNSGYFNTTYFLAGIAVSRNQYYNADYILQFGKTELLPYGHLCQVVFGPVISEFYTRFYLDLDASAGNYIHGFGGLYGRLNVGGFFNRDHFEDCLVKINVRYLTRLFFPTSKSYRFRSFFNLDYICGFNQRSGNDNYTDLSDWMKIPNVQTDSLFRGTQMMNLGLASIMYTPWYFYGFRFALRLTFQGGLVSREGSSLFRRPFYCGLGAGILIKNDNLVFPTFQVSCFVYPSVPGVSLIQFDAFETTSLWSNDFNVRPPVLQTIQN